MRQHIEELVLNAIYKLKQEKNLPVPESYPIQVERTRDNSHGDFSSNVAMVLANKIGYKPRDLAVEIIALLPASDFINNIEVAGPGFINFFLNQNAYLRTVPDILSAKND